MGLTPGLLLSDRYRLTHRIAVGGMGEVWAADDTRLARGIAVKILKSELTSDPEFVDRFRAEARITASLNHSGIAAVYDYGEVASIVGGPRDTAFLVMELVVGEPLSAVLSRCPRLSVSRTLDVVEQSGRALQAAHGRALVHRDIKPGNILITPTGQVKITDFGIAKVAHQVPVTRGGMVMGTAQYLSPEQATGNESFPPSDVYALGVVAYECLAGVRPFNGEHPVAVAMAHVRDEPRPLPADIPPPVAALVMRMLAKDPARRFPDGGSVANAVAVARHGARPAFGPTTGEVPSVATGGSTRFGSKAIAGPRASGQMSSGQMSSGPMSSGSRSSGSSPVFAPNAGRPGHPSTPVPIPGLPVPVPGVSSGTGSSGVPAYAPAIRAAVAPRRNRVQADYPAPVNRHTSLAVLLAVIVLLIAVMVGAIVLARTSAAGSIGEPSRASSASPASTRTAARQVSQVARIGRSRVARNQGAVRASI
ncbi:MAG: serine/threonine protein kinase [Actinomycetota bacterium]|nr:serine/threonine protein kinase [Actinomycetota bacterium]